MAKAARMPFMQWFIEDWLERQPVITMPPATRAIWGDALLQICTAKGGPERLREPRRIGLCRCTPKRWSRRSGRIESKGSRKSAIL